jgi:response regulator RpfG family c-di-GMP phosphodiesterase
VESFQNKLEKPLVVLVHEQSLLRLWMERTLSKWFRVCIFSTAEDALFFVRSTKVLDVLITDLNLNLSALGGCNVAREVHHIFPKSHIFIFNDVSSSDHRYIILKNIKKVKYLSKFFGSVFLVRHVKNALTKKGENFNEQSNL